MNKELNFGIETYTSENEIDWLNNLARIIQKDHYLYTVTTGNKVLRKIQVAPGFKDCELYVGDFVGLHWEGGEFYIDQLYERKNAITKASSHAAKSYHVHSYEQILATNVDQLFIMIASDQRFTLSKFERYMLIFNQKNLQLNILLSKADDEEKTLEIIKTISLHYPKVKIRPVSIYHKKTIQQVKEALDPGKTAMFVGASGAGKSTLINALLEVDLQLTDVVRRDGKGKHTTTVTKMFYVKETNTYLIDSPGFKTISTTKEMDGDILFASIYNLARNCKFADCSHQHEPHCAVMQAVEEGTLSAQLLERYVIYEKKLTGYAKYEEAKKLKEQNRYKRMKK